MQERAKYLVDHELLEALTGAVARAAVATRPAAGGIDVRIKSDQSPVTCADMRSHEILMEAASRLMPAVPVVSEEMPCLPAHVGNTFVLIDPLDGTKEYVAGSGEYTVNLAILHDGRPVVGFVAVPALNLIYRGVVGRGAERITVAADGTIRDDAAVVPIRCRPAVSGHLVAAVSRSHLDHTTVAWLDSLGVAGRTACGSALKFCRVAEGAADVYPRFGTTCEWDVAAGHAVVTAAGGSVTKPDGSDLPYGQASTDFRVPAFVAWGDRAGLNARP